MKNSSLKNGPENLFIPEDAPSLIYAIIKHSLNPDPKKKRPNSAQTVNALIKNPKLFSLKQMLKNIMTLFRCT